MRLLARSLIVFLAFHSIGCLLALRKITQESAIEIKVGPDTRRYILHVPKSYQSSRPVPLVVVLHGGGGNGRIGASMSGFTKKSDEEGFIVVYPFGWGRFDETLLTWNAGNCCGKALTDNKDDVAFIRAVVQNIKGQYAVDSSRVYATGMSNGGMMTHRLACEAADVFTGVAPVSGALNFEPCKPSRPIPMVIFHGRDDQHVLYEGGEPHKNPDSHKRTDRSVAFAVGFWKNQNGCKDVIVTKSGKVEHTHFVCDRAPLDLYSIDDEGHTWPGGEKGRLTADEPSREISATNVMWQFWADSHKAN
ncbi:MAG: prolyl oligopeptidase family serine peptidase [Spirochaetia bacterium]|nr:prolyl oligopeptidase family serine peptidase [Spirochaetia bacterium]